MSEDKYAILMETSGEECESWYYFIKYDGNKENLEHLQSQLESIDWFVLDDLSTFDLALDNLISAQTAKEMTKIDLNSCSFHRKFDGKLKKVKLNIKPKDKIEKKMGKIFNVLGYGGIDKFIDKEDIDEEDLTDCTDSESDSEENKKPRMKGPFKSSVRERNSVKKTLKEKTLKEKTLKEKDNSHDSDSYSSDIPEALK